ncbi:MAG TPA: AMP-binding protein [Patescibacteria group bacterium]|nr:AMP-binding protein [Patescibacteria group bacterium]
MNEYPQTIAWHLTALAKQDPSATAAIFPGAGVSLTYGQLNERAQTVAKALCAMGLRRGEHVAIWSPNSSHYLEVLFGCSAAGNALAAINSNCLAHELGIFLKQSDATVLFIATGHSREAEYLDAIRVVCPELPEALPGELAAKAAPRLKTVVSLGAEKIPGMLAWQEFLALGDTVADLELTARDAAITGDDILLLLFTSGTTGVSKLAMIHQSCYMTDAHYLLTSHKMTASDVICTPLPLFHAWGLIVLLTSVAAGATALIIDQFSGRNMLAAMEKYRATFVFGVPSMLVAAIAELDCCQYDISTLRGGAMAGAPCPPHLVQAVLERMGASEFCAAYGSTEAAICITGSYDDPADKRIMTVGRPLPGVNLKVIDPQTGELAPSGVQGELCINSAMNMKGYYNMPEETARTIDAEGWVHSGDLACIDKDGFCTITGRSKDIIIRGGENIAPIEIEQLLYAHSQVKDAAVVGIPSDYYGEEPVAFVILKQGSIKPLELKSYCRKHIAYQKVPVHYFLVDEFPRTGSGKVQKFKLRDLALSLIKDQL